MTNDDKAAWEKYTSECRADYGVDCSLTALSAKSPSQTFQAGRDSKPDAEWVKSSAFDFEKNDGETVALLIDGSPSRGGLGVVMFDAAGGGSVMELKAKPTALHEDKIISLCVIPKMTRGEKTQPDLQEEM